LITMFRTFRDKLYPGGEVNFWKVDISTPVTKALRKEFMEYLALLKISRHGDESSAFGIANELNLDFEDRLKFVLADSEKRESFLHARLRFQKHVLTEAEKLKDVFHLN